MARALKSFVSAGRADSVSLIGWDSKKWVIETSLDRLLVWVINLWFLDFTNAESPQFLREDKSKLDFWYLVPLAHGVNIVLHDCWDIIILKVLFICYNLNTKTEGQIETCIVFPIENVEIKVKENHIKSRLNLTFLELLRYEVISGLLMSADFFLMGLLAFFSFSSASWNFIRLPSASTLVFYAREQQSS